MWSSCARLAAGEAMKADKRDAILASATALFSRDAKVSMDDIANRAGVSKATLYLVAEDKADLFYQCVHGELQRWSAHVGTRIDPRKRVSDILPAVSRAGIEFVRDHALCRQLLAGKLGGDTPETTALFEDLRAMGNAPVAEMLRLGVRKQELRADLDVEALAPIITDMIYAPFVVYGDDWGHDAAAITRWVDTHAAMCLRGMRRR